MPKESARTYTTRMYRVACIIRSACGVYTVDSGTESTPQVEGQLAMDLSPTVYASAPVQNLGARLRASLVCKHMMYMSPERHDERKILVFQALQLHYMYCT